MEPFALKLLSNLEMARSQLFQTKVQTTKEYAKNKEKRSLPPPDRGHIFFVIVFSMPRVKRKCVDSYGSFGTLHFTVWPGSSLRLPLN
jgi:hypothetical protein